jgi:hypothetical protein
MPPEELLNALDAMILKGIGEDWRADAIRDLFEARAWLTNPEQPHGARPPQA